MTVTLDQRDAATITQNSRSNLAFAFLGMPKERKERMIIFYAYCRVIDDIADEIGPTPEEKETALNRWRTVIKEADTITPQTTLETQVIELLKELPIDRDAMLGIIDGCASDIIPCTYQTVEDLKKYTYGVASCVGIVCMTIFGAEPKARAYGIALGHALQWTNILRDVAEDLEKEDRVYLPQNSFAQSGYTMEELHNHTYNNAFLTLMKTEAHRALRMYEEVETLYAGLSPESRKAIIPNEAMKYIYKAILQKMIDDNFQIFTKRYKISTFQKLLCLWKARRIAR